MATRSEVIRSSAALYWARVQVWARQNSPPATQPASYMVFWPVIFMVPL